MAKAPCPECGSFNQKETYKGEETHGDKVVYIYEIECRECGEIWDEESIT